MRAVRYVFPVVLAVLLFSFILLEPKFKGDHNKVLAAQGQDTIQGPFVFSPVLRMEPYGLFLS